MKKAVLNKVLNKLLLPKEEQIKIVATKIKTANFRTGHIVMDMSKIFRIDLN